VIHIDEQTSIIGGIAFATLAFSVLVFLIRGATRWGRTEQRLEELVTHVRHLVEDKDATHRDLLAKMDKDNAATNIRLRWLEEHVWNRDRKAE